MLSREVTVNDAVPKPRRGIIGENTVITVQRKVDRAITDSVRTNVHTGIVKQANLRE